MLTQQTPFEAEYEQAIAYGILNEAPEPVSAKRSGLPIEIDRILEKILAKNSSERYQHTGDLVVDLRRVAKDRPGQLDRGSTSSKSSQSQSAISDRTLWKYRISLAACLLGFSGVLFLYLWQRPDSSPLRRFGLLPPVDVASYPYSANVAISPNGRHVAFVAGEGEGGLWVRDFDQERPRMVEGTAGALMPFWSPDSKFIGFVSDGELKKVPVVGGTPVRICEMSGSLFGGASWSPDGQTIVFGDRAPGVLFEVAAGGGEPRVFLDGPQLGKLLGEEVGYLGRPHFLSTGAEPTAILFTASRPNWGPSENRLVAYSLRSTSAKVVGLGDFPSYSPTGHIVHQNGFSLYDLWALPFDPESLETRGDAFLIAEAGRGPSVSVEGTLVYATESSLVPEQLIWVNRAGEKLRELGLVHGGMASPSLAPNGTMIGVNLKEGNEWGAYVFDTMRKRRTRLSGISRADGLIWSASSERVAYRSLDSSTYDTALRWIGDERQEMVSGAELRGRLRDWSQDGQRLIYTIADPDTQWDIIYLQDSEKGTGWERHPFRTTRFDERLPQLSPDGRYIAYVSNESGRDEIYVESFPERGPREVVSVNGGTFPRWGRDGSELFYVQGDVLFAVSVTSEVDFEAGSTTRLFRHPGLAKDDGRPSSYDISTDGQQILLAEQVDMGGSVVPPIRIVENWYEEFREREQNSPR